jgi:hypothetical protein
VRLVPLVGDVIEHHVRGPADNDLAFDPCHVAPA